MKFREFIDEGAKETLDLQDQKVKLQNSLKKATAAGDREKAARIRERLKRNSQRLAVQRKMQSYGAGGF